MSKVYFTSDWHFGHKNINKFRCKNKGFFRDFEDEADHCAWLIEEVLLKVRKRDTIYMLGDMAFNEDALRVIGSLPGRKVLIKGNHDVKKSDYYSKVYDLVYGIHRYKHLWLTHAPIHPSELRGKFNFHGHTHFNVIPDHDYFNCCVENLVHEFGSAIVSYDDIIDLRGGALSSG
ncbi:MAG: hypothetical protein JKY81_02410 [Colwellia sp.]|nr:hypothetical protein [Colwellia sp.]